MKYLDQEFPNTKLFPTNLIDDIQKDLDYEDSLHFDLRRLTFRYLVPHILGKKDPKKIDFKESHDGTIQGKSDAFKEKEISFWKKHYDLGITDNEVIKSGNKFKDIYSKFDSILKNQNYLKGDEFTIVDLAWYVSTKRLYAAGIPIYKYKNVKNWFDKLDKDNNFKKEANPIFLLKITKFILKIYNKLKGKYLTDLVDF
jgi:glutathione S-transferase